MSVINTMLQDLERRRVDLGRGGTFRYVRSLPEERDRRMLRVGLAVLITFIVVAAGIAFWPNSLKVGTSGATLAISAVPVVRGAPAPGSPAASVAALPEAVESRGLALAVSHELNWPTLPATSVATPGDRKLANRAPATKQAGIEKVPAANAPATRATAESDNPRRASTARDIPEDTAIRQPPKTMALVVEKSVAAFDGPKGAAAEIKQVSSQQRAENEFRQANDFLQQGRAAQAMEAFAQVLAIDPSHDGARHALVASLINAKKIAEAERLLVERQSMAPKSAGFAMMLARLQAERGDNALALETLRASQPAAGTMPVYHATMAALLARLGQHAQAVGQYQTALRVAPQSGAWWMGLGLSLQAIGSLPEALEALRRAKASDNLSPDVLAFVEQRLKQLQ